MKVGRRNLNLTSIELASRIFDEYIEQLHEGTTENLVTPDNALPADSHFSGAYRETLTKEQLVGTEGLGVIEMLREIWRVEHPEYLPMLELLDQMHGAVAEEAKSSEGDEEVPSSLIYQMW